MMGTGIGWRAVSTTVVMAFLHVLGAEAQQADVAGSEHEMGPRTVAARATAPPVLDGRLDEAIWQSAPAITEFVQIDPTEGAPGSQPTDVRILFDEDYLYIGGRMLDSGQITPRLGRRDSAWPDVDVLIVFLDTYHDHRTAYRFTVNPSGSKRDEIISGGGGGGGPPGRGGGSPGTGFGDTTWDPVWQVATSTDDEGWYAEMRIPFSQLRFRPAEQQTWGLQVDRRIGRLNEHASWAFTPRLERATVARFGHVEGISGIRSSSPIEILPFVVARAEYLDIPTNEDVSFDNPFRSGSDYFADVGVDLKYRVTSNYTLDATLNPDFGQVEIDPAEINLSAFETRFEERRPFFIEGAEIFRFGNGFGFNSAQILYTRRIGRAPQVSVPSTAVYVDAPGGTTILGAAKLTGKTPTGWSLGLLNAITGREEAVFVGESNQRQESVIEPLTNYLVGRARRDLNEGRTSFGAIATAVNRKNGNEAILLQRLPGEAYTAGFDFSHETNDRVWQWSAEFSPSLVLGDSAAINRLQRRSSRYYQRPDAPYLDYDPGATSLPGYNAKIDLGKQSGAWTGGARFNATSPGYEVNDIGFQTNADRLDMFINGGYDQPQPGDLLRRWSLRSGGGSTWNFGGDRVQSEINLFGNLQFLGYEGLNGRLGYGFRSLDDRLTRGGPLAISPGGYSANINYNSDSRQRLSFRLGGGFNRDEEGGRRNSLNVNLNFRPSDAQEIRLEPNISWNHTPAQFVTSRSDALATDTFGRRYIFAPLDQTTFSMGTRLNMTFTPRLTLEIFAEPFISTGRYGAPAELDKPETYDFLEYGADVGTAARGSDGVYTIDPDAEGPATAFTVTDLDFNFHSLLGNAVLRWEWRPGSTLFLVWQQSRSERLLSADGAGDRIIGDFDFREDARTLLDINPENRLILKLNYWLNP